MSNSSNYNTYQQMHYQALYGSTSKTKKIKSDQFKLLYNGKETGYQGKYPICKAGENKLRGTGNYNLGVFEYKRIEKIK